MLLGNVVSPFVFSFVMGRFFYFRIISESPAPTVHT